MKLKAALIGLGKQSEENYIPGIRDAQFAELIAVCDIDRQKAEKIATQLSVRGYTDYQDLFASEELDFVIVVTPHDVYRDVLEYAKKRHIHVLKEKPYARNLNEGYFFKELGEQSNIEIMTTLQRRFNPIYSTFFHIVDAIGELIFIEAKYTLTIDEPSTGWRGDKIKAGGGCLIDMGYHMVDMIIWYFGLPDRVMADFHNTSIPENTATVLFGYECGLTGSLLLSRCFPPKTEYIKVLGSRGIIEIERGRIRRMKNNGEVTESLIRESSWPLAATKQIDFFCRVIKGEEKNIGNPEYHLQHVKFLDACYQSQLQGSYVNPKLINIGRLLSEKQVSY